MKIKIKDVTPSNIRNAVQGTFYQKVSRPAHIEEQAQYRMKLCAPCLKRKKCHGCPCNVPGLFYAPHKVDADGRWGKMLSSDDWEKFKNTPEYKQTMNLND